MLLLAAVLFVGKTFANVTELHVPVNSYVFVGSPLNISKNIEAELKNLTQRENRRIISIELNYKSAFPGTANIKFAHYNLVQPLQGDEFGSYVFRYNQSTFINAQFMPVYIKKTPTIIVGSLTQEFYLASLTLTIVENEKYYQYPVGCTFKLDSVFGSSTPIYIERYSFGASKEEARESACDKARNACFERRYSTKLETCKKQ